VFYIHADITYTLYGIHLLYSRIEIIMQTAAVALPPPVNYLSLGLYNYATGDSGLGK
jgi:hypothetical protein